MALVDITASMPGTVLEILRAVGDDVDSGAEIMILESMKMEIPVESPQAGRIAELVVEEGQHVEDGDLLIRLEA